RHLNRRSERVHGSRSLGPTSNAVFPLAVGPVTTVNLPSGNLTVTSLSSNFRAALSPTTVCKSVTLDAADWIGVVSDSTLFHCRVAPTSPRPVSPSVGSDPCLSEDTCSDTSSSCR
ncbi:unnamed protein product, partial [Mycena citricolor]